MMPCDINMSLPSSSPSHSVKVGSKGCHTEHEEEIDLSCVQCRVGGVVVVVVREYHKHLSQALQWGYLDLP